MYLQRTESSIVPPPQREAPPPQPLEEGRHWEGLAGETPPAAPLEPGGKRIIASREPCGVGIDTHSRFIQVCILVQLPGQEGRRYDREFSTDWSDLLAADAWITGTLQAHNLQFQHYTIESTGVYHRPILLALQGTAHVVNPVLANPSRRKTDVLDAVLLAQHDMHRLWPPAYVPDLEVEALRCFMRMRNAALANRTKTSNRIRNVVLRFGHTFLNVRSFRNAESRALLDQLLKNQMPDAPGVCPVPFPEGARWLLKELITSWTEYGEHVALLEKATLHQLESVQVPMGKQGDLRPGKELYKLLLTVPGVGPQCALAWIAEIVDWRRFPGTKQVAAFCGCDPSVKVSAGKVTSATMRKGNKHLHRGLFHAAMTVVRGKIGKLGRWGYNISRRQKRGGFKKATNAVARKLSHACWHVQRTGKPYDDSKYAGMRVARVPEIPISEMGLPPRANLPGKNAQELVAALFTGELNEVKGVGDKWLAQLKAWIQVHQTGWLSWEPCATGTDESSNAKED